MEDAAVLLASSLFAASDVPRRTEEKPISYGLMHYLYYIIKQKTYVFNIELEIFNIDFKYFPKIPLPSIQHLPKITIIPFLSLEISTNHIFSLSFINHFIPLTLSKSFISKTAHR